MLILFHCTESNKWRTAGAQNQAATFSSEPVPIDSYVKMPSFTVEINSLVKNTVGDNFLHLRSLSSSFGDWNSGILFVFYSEWRPGSYSYPLYTVCSPKHGWCELLLEACSLWDTTRGRKGQRAVSTGGGVTLTVGSFRHEVGLKAAGFKKRSAGLWSPPIMS